MHIRGVRLLLMTNLLKIRVVFLLDPMLPSSFMSGNSDHVSGLKISSFCYFKVCISRDYLRPLHRNILAKGINTVVIMPNRCLYTASFHEFIGTSPLAILGALHNNYHGEALTTTDDA